MPSTDNEKYTTILYPFRNNKLETREFKAFPLSFDPYNLYMQLSHFIVNNNQHTWIKAECKMGNQTVTHYIFFLLYTG